MEVLSITALLKIIWKNYKLLATIAILTIIGSGIISFLLPVYYKSTTTIFPVKLAQVPVNETAFRRGNISEFGETGEAEQALEILNSSTLMERVINKFDLYSHYEIKSTDIGAKFFAFKAFQGNVRINRTKFNSIQITVKDKDPLMASNIANAVASYLDTLKYEMVQLRAKELVNSLELQRNKQQRIIDSLKKEMDLLAGAGIMSQFQRGYLLEAYGQSIGSERNQMKSLLDSNIKLGEDFDRLERIYGWEIENLLLINKFLLQTKADGDIQFSQKFVVDAAEPAQRKSYPVRWLVVMVSLISSMLISVGLLLFQNRWPEIKKALTV